MPGVYPNLAALLALLVPALALLSPVGGPAILYVLALLGLVAILHNAVSRLEPFRWRELSAALVLVGPLLCMLTTSLFQGVWSNSELEKVSRFALALPAYWLLLRVRRGLLQNIQWSLLVGAYGGALLIITLLVWLGEWRGVVSDHGGRYNAVTFANLMLFFGLASLLTLNWRMTPWPRIEAAVKVAAAAATVYGTVISQTRSSWMLLPIFGLVLLLSVRKWTLRRRVYCAIATMVILVGGSVTLWSFNDRMALAVQNVQDFTQGGNRDTSVGIRLQLWEASWSIFRESPLVGVGPSHFRSELAKLGKRGIVTKAVVDGYGEPHNDFFGAMAGYGLLGLLSMLALYLAPAWVFLRRMASDDRVIRTGAQIGLLFCLGYCAFSLTEMMFRNMRSVPIYSVTLVLLLALTAPRAPQAPRAA
ncbi:O-antigen ligase [Bordetella bronchiseptica SBL-F6116]|uniref:O-antigen ligase family protein n=1 Tax=Bordetella bronchiseptica TaxID=518 RepID=UPI00045B94DC|nr:O-antigen ligase family protein [Bordetella bronchiseptica]KCV34579.1 O-antigen ligase [Bordetella bronchiseptica 00-P-2730]KDD98925.1 O-antigen ligase [Bordetella bronchiseptica SBL-F6116]